MLQLTNTVQDMKALLSAEQMTRSESNDELKKRLQTAIEKVTSFAIRTSGGMDKGSLLLDGEATRDLILLEDEDNGFRTLATLENRPVWIEWRRYKIVIAMGETGMHEPAPDPQSIRNVERLASLLSETDKPDECRLPKCIGYIKDTDSESF